jgi:hypothetical protein
VASYRLPAAAGPGYTLLGSPTVIANLNVTGQFPIIAARLWDVDPSTGNETLVARGVYRLDSSAPNGLQVFQLHPGAWHFAAGHIPKLELLGQDSPYVRSSNGQFSISVSDLQLRLPVHEAPGTAPGVGAPLPPVQAHPHACVPRPSSRILRRRTHGSRHALTVFGTAAEHRCATASSARRRRQRVAHVYVSVYERLGHGRCRFLGRRGTLGPLRACGRPITLLARGTSHWRLRIRTSLPPGRYLIQSVAVDRLHHRQPRKAVSLVAIRVR